MKRIALVLLAAFALVAVAGCGGSGDENTYVNKVNAVDAKARAALTTARNTSGTPAAAAKSFDATAGALDPVIADYKAIDPPDNAKSAHTLTVAGWTGIAGLFRKIAADFRAAKTPADYNAIARQVADLSSEKPFRQLDEARQELAKAGYKVKSDTTTTK